MPLAYENECQILSARGFGVVWCWWRVSMALFTVLSDPYPPQSHRFRTRLPRNRTCECSTSTIHSKDVFCQFVSSWTARAPMVIISQTARESHVTSCSEAAGISGDVVGKDDGAHRSLAWPALAHQKHLYVRSQRWALLVFSSDRTKTTRLVYGCVDSEQSHRWPLLFSSCWQVWCCFVVVMFCRCGCLG